MPSFGWILAQDLTWGHQCFDDGDVTEAPFDSLKRSSDCALLPLLTITASRSPSSHKRPSALSRSQHGCRPLFWRLPPLNYPRQHITEDGPLVFQTNRLVMVEERDTDPDTGLGQCRQDNVTIPTEDWRSCDDDTHNRLQRRM